MNSNISPVYAAASQSLIELGEEGFQPYAFSEDHTDVDVEIQLV